MVLQGILFDSLQGLGLILRKIACVACIAVKLKLEFTKEPVEGLFADVRQGKLEDNVKGNLKKSRLNN